MVQSLTYILIECTKNEKFSSMYRLIDDQNNAHDHGKIKIEYLHFR